jgi:multicomponent Na+:H+ antiporter subunit C
MALLFAVLVGVLYGTGFYMMLRRSVVKEIIGLALLAHAANLLIFGAASLTRGVPPIIPAGAAGLQHGAADPVPQALILTAIVIGFGVTAFAIVLIRRAYEATGSDDFDAFLSTDTGEAREESH